MVTQVGQNVVKEALKATKQPNQQQPNQMSAQTAMPHQPHVMVQPQEKDADRDMKYLKKFMRYKPPPFEGKMDPFLSEKLDNESREDPKHPPDLGSW